MPNSDHETDSLQDAAERCFLPVRSNLYCSIGFTIFWAVLGFAIIAAVVIHHGGLFPRTMLAIAIIGIVFSVMVGLGVLFTFSALKAKLIITPEKITQYGLLGTTTLSFKEIDSITWGSTMSGLRFPNVTLISSSKLIFLQIEIQTYPEEHRKEVVYILRSAIDESIQKDWEKFEELHFLIPESGKAHYGKFHFYFDLLLIGNIIAFGILYRIFFIDAFLSLALMAFFALVWDYFLYRKAVRRFRKAQKEHGSSDER